MDHWGKKSLTFLSGLPYIIYYSTQNEFIQLLKFYLQFGVLHFLKVTWDLFLWVNRSRRHLLPPYRITDTGLNWKERDRCWCRSERQMCFVSVSCSDRARCDQHGGPASEVSQRSPHLSVTCWTLHLFRPTTPSSSSQQRSSICSSSFFSCDPFKITPSVPPAWLTPLALVGSPHLTLSLPCWPTWWHLTPLPGYHDS